MNNALRFSLPNFILFQIGWFSCVLGGAAGQPLTGVIIAGLIIFFHIHRAQQPWKEILLIFIAMTIGAVWDSLLVWMSWVDYPAGILIPNTAPYWIVVMWALFTTTLNISMRWLKGRYGLALLLGAVAGPLAYYGGVRLGAVDFISVNHAVIALAIGWAVFTPLLVAFSNKMDGYPALAIKSRG